MAEIINASVIGLGLMGGSVAKALKKTGRYKITGYDKDVNVLEAAKHEDAADVFTDDALVAVKHADLVIVCLYPKAAVEFILWNMESFQKSAVITDICGVKRYVTEEIRPHLRKDISFVPGHPMAGREKKGFQMSDSELFIGCNYLIAAGKNTDEQALQMVRTMAMDLGAAQLVPTDPEKHDAYIAYTSQLPHAISCAYVRCMNNRALLNHAAGSLKDVSRVANINARMWAEIFTENSDNLAKECEHMAQELLKIAELVREGDAGALAAYMRSCTEIMEKRNEQA